MHLTASEASGASRCWSDGAESNAKEEDEEDDEDDDGACAATPGANDAAVWSRMARSAAERPGCFFESSDALSCDGGCSG